MIEVNNDLSLNTVVIGVCIGVGTWLLRGIGKLILAALTKFGEHAIKLYGEMVLVKNSLDEFNRRTADHEKLRTDLNNYYKQFRELRTDFDNSQRHS